MTEQPPYPGPIGTVPPAPRWRGRAHDEAQPGPAPADTPTPPSPPSPRLPPQFPPRPGRGRLAAGAVALALAAAAVGGGVGAAVGDSGGTTTVSSAGLTSATGTSAGTSPAAAGTVTAAARTVLPSVVTIKERSSTESGTGSGIIIRSDGYILTNNHVVSAAADGNGSLSVILNDGRTVTAHIVGRDPSSDLAVIRVDGVSGLTAATLGRSDNLQVGELVVAVGSPLGLSGTVTSGIVSALHRPVRTGDPSVTDTNAVLDAIQTDAPINPGNSGGPLVNSRGEVIGINSAIATTGGSSGGAPGQASGQSGYIGVGFAIPVDSARTVAEQLIHDGRATHPYLGVTASTNGAEDGTDTGTGATVRSVVPGGPADRAGLRPSDVITAVAGRRVGGVDGLVVAVRSHGIGEMVTVSYQRDGSERTAQVTLAEQPARTS